MLNFVFANRSCPTRPGSVLALLLALAAAAVPATAEAASATADAKRPPPQFGVEMYLKGTHGYRIGFFAANHHTVAVTAFNGEGRATYSVTGRASTERIKANFGKFGRISARFIPSRKQPRPLGKRGCRTVSGYFVGSIRFRGELGYTQVAARRARGVVSPSGRGCRARIAARPNLPGLLAKADEPEIGITTMGAVARTKGRKVSFIDAELNEIFADGQTVPVLILTFASVEEHRGRISIERGAILFPDRPVTVVSPPGQQPLSATVKAPKPFSGTGAYVAGAAPGATPTWTGDLAVPLPGAGLVPLTGPGFAAMLCSGNSSKKAQSCLDELEAFE